MEKNLLVLNETRPWLGRAEYVERVARKGFERKHIKVVINTLEEYISLESFSMYPEDNILKLYLKKKQIITN